jgi:hypothetical protein
LLAYHPIAFILLEFSQFFYGQSQVANSRGHAQKKEYNSQPGIGIEPLIQVSADAKPDKDR